MLGLNVVQGIVISYKTSPQRTTLTLENYGTNAYILSKASMFSVYCSGMINENNQAGLIQ